MECVLRKFGSYEKFEEVTGGSILPKSQVWAAVRKYLQKEGCVGEVSMDEWVGGWMDRCKPLISTRNSHFQQLERGNPQRMKVSGKN